jgi:hypothetical protein
MIRVRVDFFLQLLEAACLSDDEISALHERLGHRLTRSKGTAGPMKRTLYLPNDRLDPL